MASTFRARFFRNFAAITYSFLLKFLDFVRLSFAPSSSVRDSFFHSLRTSSIFGLRKDKGREECRRVERKRGKCFPKNP